MNGGSGSSVTSLADAACPLEVADDRRFVNTMPDYCAEGLGASIASGGSAVALLALPTECDFLTAGLLLADKAIEGMQHQARGDGPFLYTGLLGAALLCLRCHGAVSSAGAGSQAGEQYLARAADLVLRCEKEAAGHRTYFSFFCGQPGVHAVGAAVAAAREDVRNLDWHMEQLRGLVQDPRLRLTAQQLQEEERERAAALGGTLPSNPGNVPNEILYGRVGAIWAVLFANSACCQANLDDHTIPVSLLDPVAAAVVACGRSLSREDQATRRSSVGGTAGGGGGYPALMYEWHGVRYWGAAHGLAGVLHVLLLAHQAGVKLSPALLLPEGADFQERERGEEACLADMKSTLRYMLAHRFLGGNFPSSEERAGRDQLVHWCHGAPGVALTLAEFAKAFPLEHDFLEGAEETARVVWQRGLLRRIGLCHGISGNAYVFLALARGTPGASPGQLHRARAFGAFLLWRWESLVAQGLMHPGDSAFSLMEGLGGPACLFLDLAHPQAAKFPGFDL